MNASDTVKFLAVALPLRTKYSNLHFFQKPLETAPCAPEDAPEKNNSDASTAKIAEVDAANNNEKVMNGGGGDELKELRGLKRDVSLSTSSSGDSTDTVIFVEKLLLKVF